MVRLPLSCLPRVLPPRERAGTSCSTPIARTGRSPPFPPFPLRRLGLSTYLCLLSRSQIHDRAWRTHLDDQLYLGHVAVTGAVLVIVVRHPRRDLRSRRMKQALLSRGDSRVVYGRQRR